MNSGAGRGVRRGARHRPRAVNGAAVDLGPLRDHLGYALRRAQLCAFADVIATLQVVNLSPGEYSVLTVVDRNPGVRPSDIGTALAIKKANLVPVLTTLVRRGLLERCSSATDGRALAIHLTACGRRLLARAQRLQARHETRLTARVGPRGRARLLRLLRQLSEPFPESACTTVEAGS